MATLLERIARRQQRQRDRANRGPSFRFPSVSLGPKIDADGVASARNPGLEMAEALAEESQQAEIREATTQTGGVSATTSIVGEAGELLQADTFYIHSIETSGIDDDGFIQNLAFIQKTLSASELEGLDPRSVYIAADLYLVTSGGATAVYDYTPVSEVDDLMIGLLGTNRLRYDSSEKRALEGKAGRNKPSADDISEYINRQAFLGMGTPKPPESDELVSNIIENKAGIKLSSF